MAKCVREKCGNTARQNVPWCNHHYEAERRRREALGGRKCGYIPSEIVLNHIRLLQQTGLGYRRIAELAGVTLQTVQRYNRHPYAYVDTAHKILSIQIPKAPHLLAANAAKVDITGSMRRLQALNVLGYTSRELSERLGVTETQIYIWAHGRQRNIFAEKARDIAKLYAEIEMIPAPDSYGGRRVKTRAKKNGWAPPMAWDDIDNPDAQPESPEGDRDDWFDDYQELRHLGLTDKKIAERMGIETKSLATKLYRLRRLHATSNIDQEYEPVRQGDEQMVRAS